MGRGISTITTKGISCIPLSFAWTFRHIIKGGSGHAGRAFIGEMVVGRNGKIKKGKLGVAKLPPVPPILCALVSAGRRLNKCG